jgi:hypothetical protein
VTNGDRQGWRTDPFGRHEFRYFSEGEPTRLVRDRGVDSYDEPPADLWGRESNATAQPDALSGAGDVSTAAAFEYPPDVSTRSSGHKVAIAGVAVVLVAAAVGGVLLLTSSSNPNPGQAASETTAAFVTAAAEHTLAEHTADITLSGTIQVDGQSVALSGNGAANFSTNAAKINISIQADGHSIVANEILVDGDLYLAETVDGKGLSQYTGGAAWIAMPVQQSATADVDGTSPWSSLKVLEQHGDSVRSLGTALVSGVTCSGYTVTPSKQAMIAAARKAISRLPSSEASAGMRIVQAMSPPTFTVWIDGQKMMREMSVNLQLSGVGAVATANMSATMALSNYGTPVVVKAPPKSDTIPLSALSSALSGSTS